MTHLMTLLAMINLIMGFEFTLTSNQIDNNDYYCKYGVCFIPK